MDLAAFAGFDGNFDLNIFAADQPQAVQRHKTGAKTEGGANTFKMNKVQ